MTQSESGSPAASRAPAAAADAPAHAPHRRQGRSAKRPRLPAVLSLIGAAALLAACQSESGGVDPVFGVVPSPFVVGSGQPVPKGGGRSMVGEPYKVAGRWFHPKEDADYEAEGMASWYGKRFHGRRTANGEVFDMSRLTGAHPTLPLPSYARVTNLGNGRSVVVRLNDRGPFHGKRIVDVSAKTAEVLDFKRAGKAKVRVEYIGPARADGRDDDVLLASYRGPADTGGPPDTASGRGVMVASNTQRSSGRGLFGRLLNRSEPAADHGAAEPSRREAVPAPQPAAAPGSDPDRPDPIRETLIAYAAPAAGAAAGAQVAEDDQEALQSLLEQYDAAQEAMPAGESPVIESGDPVAALIGQTFGQPVDAAGAMPDAATALTDDRIGTAHAIFAAVDQGAAPEKPKSVVTSVR